MAPQQNAQRPEHLLAASQDAMPSQQFKCTTTEAAETEWHRTVTTVWQFQALIT